ncbi:hypothetical protein V1514DRAFT_335610 [Lipomyces japonicus]|uniref:uncharacterized protein n=1 Tax=Lipomyces japonicus TaxID=56871 RepID=UPI0034CD38A9
MAETESFKHTVLITGATGLLGRETVKQFANDPNWNVIGTGLTRVSAPIIELDLVDTPKVADFIKRSKPNIVIHAAAERRPDVVANDPAQARLINVNVTRHVARITADLDVPLIYISTDYVFDGTKPPYEPSDEPNPTNVYGITKLEGEKVALQANKKTIVLRVPVLYGPVETSNESSINQLVDITLNEAQKDDVGMDNWQVRYPTNTQDIGRVLKDLTDLLIRGTGTNLPSILHFSAKQQFTKYEICLIFGELLGVPITHLKNIDSFKDANQGAVSRPYNCQLSTKKLEELGVDVSFVDFKEWWKHQLLPPRRK